MRTITWTDHGTAGDIEREGIVWAPGPLPHTVWVALAEVVEAGFAPRSDEMVVVHTQTMRKVNGDPRRMGGARDWTLEWGWLRTGDQGARIEARGYSDRYDKFGASMGIKRSKALPETEWSALVDTAPEQLDITALPAAA